jgi:hypothetical protein
MIKMIGNGTMIRRVNINRNKFSTKIRATPKVNELQRVGEFYKKILPLLLLASKKLNSPASRFREMTKKVKRGHVKTLKKAICMMGPEKAVSISIKAMGKYKTFEALEEIVSLNPDEKNIWLEIGEKNQQKMGEVVLTNMKNHEYNE